MTHLFAFIAGYATGLVAGLLLEVKVFGEPPMKQGEEK